MWTKKVDRNFFQHLTVSQIPRNFKILTSENVLHFLGAQGIIIVYDVTDRETFDNVRTWITEIEKYSQAGVCKILVGNKCDMEDRR